MRTDHVQRSYSFACLDCGHGWEGAYDIDLAAAEHARITAVCHLDGEHVSPSLQSPRCPACEGRKLRIMRPGRAATARLHQR
jgi:Zn finger protein HypA/HybF involved in hydrogenase expression